MATKTKKTNNEVKENVEKIETQETEAIETSEPVEGENEEQTAEAVKIGWKTRLGTKLINLDVKKDKKDKEKKSDEKKAKKSSKVAKIVIGTVVGGAAIGTAAAIGISHARKPDIIDVDDYEVIPDDEPELIELKRSEVEEPVEVIVNDTVCVE